MGLFKSIEKLTQSLVRMMRMNGEITLRNYGPKESCRRSSSHAASPQ